MYTSMKARWLSLGLVILLSSFPTTRQAVLSEEVNDLHSPPEREQTTLADTEDELFTQAAQSTGEVLEQTTTEQPEVCPNCNKDRKLSQLSKEDLDEIHLNLFKRKLLEKLGMHSAPPQISTPNRRLPLRYLYPPSSSSDFWQRDLQRMQNDRSKREQTQYQSEERIEEIFVFGTVVSCSNQPNALCLTFTMSESLPIGMLASAELWLHRVTGHAVVSELFTNRDKKLRVKKISGVHSRDVWQRFKMTKLVRRWLRYPDQQHGVEVECKTCKQHLSGMNITEDNTPFLFIRLGEQQRRRTKRNVNDCQGDCCLVPFVVDFQQLGWSHFIKVPSRIRTNYCNGSCSAMAGGIRQDLGDRFSIMKHYRNISACCAPIRGAVVDILYVNDKGEYIRQKLQNMIALECGCVL